MSTVPLKQHFKRKNKKNYAWQLTPVRRTNPTCNPPNTCAKITTAADCQAWLIMNECHYIMLHKQFVYCNHRGTVSQRREEEDIRLLFNFKRLGKDGYYARNSGSTSVEELVWAWRRLVWTSKGVPELSLTSRSTKKTWARFSCGKHRWLTPFYSLISFTDSRHFYVMADQMR